MGKLLSVYIPTFNRIHFLETCLASFCCQMAPLLDQIDLWVVDNHSTDDTDTKVKAIMADYPFVNYYRQDRNLGADGNFKWCFDHAKTDFIWIFGDDDVLLDGKLDFLINILKGLDPDLVYVNGYGYNGADFRTEKPQKKPLRDRGLFSTYESPKRFLRRVHYYLTFSTGNIVKKTVIKSHDASSRYMGTNLVQLGWIVEALLNGRKFVYVNDLTIAVKMNNTGGYRLFDTFARAFDDILESYKSLNKRYTYLKNITRFHLMLSFFPTFIIASRKDHSKSFIRENPETILKQLYKDSAWYYLFVAPVLKLPLKWAATYHKYFLRNINKLINAFS